MYEFTASIRDKRTGGIFFITVRAENAGIARMILEGQYGRENIVTGPC